MYITKLQRKNPFKENRPGRHWYEGFRKRHPKIAQRAAQNLPKTRADITEDDLKEWYSEVDKDIFKQNLKNIHPSRVFNCDETSIQFCPNPEQVLAEKGARTVYKVVDALERECMTVLFMCSADGKIGPPMLMFASKTAVPQKVLSNCPEGWGLGVSDTG